MTEHLFGALARRTSSDDFGIINLFEICEDRKEKMLRLK